MIRRREFSTGLGSATAWPVVARARVPFCVPTPFGSARSRYSHCQRLEALSLSVRPKTS